MTQTIAPKPANAATRILGAKWFPIAVIALVAIAYFLPYLNFNSVLLGSDDGPRGWHTYGDFGHGPKSFADRWAPLNGGTAMMEQRFGSFISPMYPLHLILPKYAQRVIEYIFWMFAAGLLMFGYLRQVAVSRSVSLVAAIAFMLAPAFLSNVFTGHYVKMEVIALLPGIMLLTERMLRKVSLVDLVALPALLALDVYSRHLQLAFFTFLGVGIYFAARMTYSFVRKETPLPEALKRTGMFAAAWVIFTLITSMNTFPSVHHADTISKRAGGVDYEYASSFALNPEEIVSFVEPDFLGWYDKYWGRNALKLNSEYFGGLIVLLAIMLFVMRKQSFDRVLLGLFCVGALLFALGEHTPFHRIVYSLVPGIKSFRAPSMMYIWFYFPAMVLAAYALHEILHIDWSKSPAMRKRVQIFALVTTGLSLVYAFGAGAFAQWWFSSIMPPAMQDQQHSQILTAALPSIKTGGFLVFLMVAGFLAALHFAVGGKLSRTVFLAIVLGILTVDLVRISLPFVTKCVQPKNFFVRQEKAEESIGAYLHRLDSGIYRVHNLLPLQKFYIRDIDLTYIFDDFTDQQYNSIIQDLQQLSYAMGRPEYASNPGIQRRFRNMLSFLDARYILSPTDMQVPGLEKVVGSGGLVIYKNPQAFARVHLSSKVIPADSAERAVKETFDRDTFVSDFAIVDARTWGSRQLDTLRDNSINDTVAVKLFDSRMGRIIADVSSSREQMLVVDENYVPGWTATLNGKPADVLPVNYAWKGVVVPRGKSTVEFVYDSPIAEKWRRVTLISGILFGLFALGVLGWEILRRVRTTPTRGA